jgi:hypothetical protein
MSETGPRRWTAEAERQLLDKKVKLHFELRGAALYGFCLTG